MKALTIRLDDIVSKPITNEDQFRGTSQLIDQLVDADMLEDAQSFGYSESPNCAGY